jgi:uncharacterized membrane protein HdeD (DUF308 family)
LRHIRLASPDVSLCISWNKERARVMNAEAGKCPACEQLDREFRHLKSDWWWLFLFGVLLTVCGAVAIVFPAITSVAAMVILGVVLMVAGIANIITSFWAGKWSGVLVQMFVGVLYLVVGLLIRETPVQSAITMTMFVAAFFIVAGGFRVLAALVVRFPYWGWALLNGTITLLLGVIICRHFPQDRFWVVGLLIGLEMLFSGWTWIMLSLAVRNLPDKMAA